MVKYLYEALCNYFNHLCNTGYIKYSEVEKLLLLSAIHRLVDCDFRGYLNREDYNSINNALYNLYGTSCLVPYPDYYGGKHKRIMYTCSISELAHRVDDLEKLNAIDKTIIVPSDKSIEVSDIPIEGIDE